MASLVLAPISRTRSSLPHSEDGRQVPPAPVWCRQAQTSRTEMPSSAINGPPVTKLERSDKRNRAPYAISADLSIRFIRCRQVVKSSSRQPLGRIHELAVRAEQVDEGQLPRRKDGAGGHAELAMTGRTFETPTGRQVVDISHPQADRPARHLSLATAVGRTGDRRPPRHRRKSP
ncbi:hypothetical protein Pden_0253 [Paracoccus denitrificans PD1222]|uniref:Uncharacterized protein n=1 Tax=Paracoccus denitrificans (strain Pd 1222) TaxID=318586 RepID=A1AYM3_PARDP|nr:hypothetical protein Pden_0253 [Paracoccus denitrificans PD1222]